MKQNYFETVLGAVVLLVAGLFLYIAYTMSAPDLLSGSYDLRAKFNHIDGISMGNDIRIAGVKVGSVQKIDLDEKTFEAVVTFRLKDSVHLPQDSSAEILSDGLMGGKFINITPGGAEENFKPRDMIEKTQSSVGLEQLLSKFMFSSSNEKN